MDNSYLLESEINSLCRTCLKQIIESTKYDIFLMPSLAKYLSVCTSLMIEESDGYPKHICNNCYQKIQNFYEFREMCVKSIQKFEEIKYSLQNLKNSNELNSNQIEKENEDSSQLKEKYFKCEINDKSVKDVEEFEINQDETRGTDTSDSQCDDLKKESIINETSIEKNVPLSNEDTIDYKRRKQEDKKSSKSTKSNNEVFTCDVCSKRFYKNEKYEAHKRTHLGLKPWECSQCKKQYKKRSSLKNHIQYEHGEARDVFEIFACTFEGCNKSYKFKQTLRAHIRKVHVEINEQAKERKSYMCEQCGKSMSTLAALNRHRILHSGELPFKCDVCSKRYVTKYKLGEHMRRHNGIKNFICSICGLKKISQHELNVHMNYHTKNKQIKCKYCQYASGNIGNVTRHERIVHHGIKAFTCKFCGNSFGKSETLKHHVMTHTGEKPHECHLCGRRFIQPTALKTHLKRHAKKTIKNRDGNQQQELEQQQQQQESELQERQDSTVSEDCNDDNQIQSIQAATNSYNDEFMKTVESSTNADSSC